MAVPLVADLRIVTVVTKNLVSEVALPDRPQELGKGKRAQDQAALESAFATAPSIQAARGHLAGPFLWSGAVGRGCLVAAGHPYPAGSWYSDATCRLSSSSMGVVGTPT